MISAYATARPGNALDMFWLHHRRSGQLQDMLRYHLAISANFWVTFRICLDMYVSSRMIYDLLNCWAEKGDTNLSDEMSSCILSWKCSFGIMEASFPGVLHSGSCNAAESLLSFYTPTIFGFIYV